MVDLVTRAATRCPNYLAGAAQRHIEEAGIPERFRDARLSSFEVAGLPGERQLTAARAACLAFIKEPAATGLLIWGAPGVGKTHLLAATLRGLLTAHPAWTGRFVEFTSLCAQIQATFQDGYEGPREAEILAPIYDASIVALDELGTRRASPFVADTLYLLINHWYNRRTPLLVSTNYDPEGKGKDSLAERLGESRILSRILGMCDPVPLDRCADYRPRLKKAVDTRKT